MVVLREILFSLSIGIKGKDNHDIIWYNFTWLIVYEPQSSHKKDLSDPSPHATYVTKFITKRESTGRTIIKYI